MGSIKIAMFQDNPSRDKWISYFESCGYQVRVENTKTVSQGFPLQNIYVEFPTNYDKDKVVKDFQSYFSANTSSRTTIETDVQTQLKGMKIDYINSQTLKSERCTHDCHKVQELRGNLLPMLDLEIKGFLDRKFINIEEGDDPVLCLGPKDKQRYRTITHLRQEINSICEEALKSRKGLKTEEEIQAWQTSYVGKVQGAISESLTNNKLDKYTPFEKLGIAMLNVLAAITAPIKYAITKEAFYSLKGKLREVTEEAQETVNKFEFK